MVYSYSSVQQYRACITQSDMAYPSGRHCPHETLCIIACTLHPCLVSILIYAIPILPSIIICNFLLVSCLYGLLLAVIYIQNRVSTVRWWSEMPRWFRLWHLYFTGLANFEAFTKLFLRLCPPKDIITWASWSHAFSIKRVCEALDRVVCCKYLMNMLIMHRCCNLRSWNIW